MRNITIVGAGQSGLQLGLEQIPVNFTHSQRA
jgi:hypothetical protein